MAMWLPSLTRETGRPLYEAIVDALERDIQRGAIRAGDYLPAYRSLAARLGISPGTAERAYAVAASRGLVVRHVGRGTAVLPVRNAALFGRSGAINLSTNLPLQHLGPDVATALRDAARLPDLAELLHYVDAAGLPQHREAGAHFLRGLGLDVDGSRVVICSGGQHAIYVALASLTEPGDTVLVEETTYPGVLAAARARGIRTRTVGMDEQGIVPDALDAACRRGKVRALFSMPTVHNPTGITMPRNRRERIVEVLRRNELVLIEDDTYAFLDPDAPPPLSQALSDQSFYMHSLSKTIAPGLRVAFMAVPARALNAALIAIVASTAMASPLAVELACRWLADGAQKKIIVQKRREAARRTALAREIFRPFDFLASDPGLFLWLRLPRGIQSTQFAGQVLERGVSVTPSDAFVSMPTKQLPRCVRVCLGGPRDIAELERGLRVIRRALETAGPPAKATM